MIWQTQNQQQTQSLEKGSCASTQPLNDYSAAEARIKYLKGLDKVGQGQVIPRQNQLNQVLDRLSLAECSITVTSFGRIAFYVAILELIAVSVKAVVEGKKLCLTSVL